MKQRLCGVFWVVPPVGCAGAPGDCCLGSQGLGDRLWLPFSAVMDTYVTLLLLLQPG